MMNNTVSIVTTTAKKFNLCLDTKFEPFIFVKK